MVDATDVQAAVDSLAAKVNQSVLIEDRDQYPVWWSTLGDVDAARRATILNRHVEPAAAAVVHDYGLTKATAPVHTPAIPSAGMWARWCVPVRADGQFLGLLWVLDPDDAVAEDDLPALVECAELAAEVLAKRRRVEAHTRIRRTELLEQLLNGPDQAAARALIHLERLSANPQVQVQAPGRPSGWALPDGLSAHIASRHTRGATSGQPIPLENLAEAVRRAVATRRVIAAGGRLEPASWDALGPWRLIVEAPDSVHVADLHPAAQQLLDHDNPDLVNTARAVLDCGADISAAAQQLHVHRTTLYYRMDRIRELVGVDLRADESRTGMQLALWLAAYRSTR